MKDKIILGKYEICKPPKTIFTIYGPRQEVISIKREPVGFGPPPKEKK